jgi:hypothetical protein
MKERGNIIVYRKANKIDFSLANRIREKKKENIIVYRIEQCRTTNRGNILFIESFADQYSLWRTIWSLYSFGIQCRASMRRASRRTIYAVMVALGSATFGRPSGPHIAEFVVSTTRIRCANQAPYMLSLAQTEITPSFIRGDFLSVVSSFPRSFLDIAFRGLIWRELLGFICIFECNCMVFYRIDGVCRI